MADPKVGADVKAIFGLCLALMGLASALDSGALGWVVSPIVILGLIYCVARAPLRHSYLALAFAAVTLDTPFDKFASGNYESPFIRIGAVLFEKLNNTTGISPLVTSGADIILLTMGITAYVREKSRSPIDRLGRVPTPRPLVRLAQIALLGAGFVWLMGMVRGGTFSWSLWQVQRVVYLPCLFLLCHLALRGPRDHALLAKVLVAAALLRAVIAVLIKRLVVLPPDEWGTVPVLPYATSHSDSVLFALASVLLVLLVVERAGRRARWLVIMCLPILVLGMIANTRRLVWVQIGVVLVTLYFVTPDRPYKRTLRRIAMILAPFVAIYAATGWNSQWGSFYKPVRIARSVIDAKSDGSSLWRELENFNLIFTLKQSPILGWGYGRPFIEVIPLPAVDYSLEYYLPHNGILGLLAFAGYFGFTAITLMWAAGVYFAMRGYHAAKTPTDRVTGIVAVGAVLIYMVQVFGDLGLGSLTGIYLLAPALAAGGKLAAATGGWGRAGQPVDGPAAAAPARADVGMARPGWPGLASGSKR
jgi:hypothetical protein